jgi:hypothetical protein
MDETSFLVPVPKRTRELYLHARNHVIHRIGYRIARFCTHVRVTDIVMSDQITHASREGLRHFDQIRLITDDSDGDLVHTRHLIGHLDNGLTTLAPLGQ